jgi:hypothetical protein
MGQPGAVVEFVGGHADGLRRRVAIHKGQLPSLIRVPLERRGPGGVLLEVAEALYRRVGKTHRYEYRGRGDGRPA